MNKDMIATYTNSEELISVREFYGEGGKIDMCKAITEMIANGKAEGKAEDIIELLEDLGEIPEETKIMIMQQKNLDVLNAWHKLAARAMSIEEFETKIA